MRFSTFKDHPPWSTSRLYTLYVVFLFQIGMLLFLSLDSRAGGPDTPTGVGHRLADLEHYAEQGLDAHGNELPRDQEQKDAKIKERNESLTSQRSRLFNEDGSRRTQDNVWNRQQLDTAYQAYLARQRAYLQAAYDAAVNDAKKAGKTGRRLRKDPRVQRYRRALQANEDEFTRNKWKVRTDAPPAPPSGSSNVGISNGTPQDASAFAFSGTVRTVLCPEDSDHQDTIRFAGGVIFDFESPNAVLEDMGETWPAGSENSPMTGESSANGPIWIEYGQWSLKPNYYLDLGYGFNNDRTIAWNDEQPATGSVLPNTYFEFLDTGNMTDAWKGDVNEDQMLQWGDRIKISDISQVWNSPLEWAMTYTHSQYCPKDKRKLRNAGKEWWVWWEMDSGNNTAPAPGLKASTWPVTPARPIPEVRIER